MKKTEDSIRGDINSIVQRTFPKFAGENKCNACD